MPDWSELLKRKAAEAHDRPAQPPAPEQTPAPVPAEEHPDPCPMGAVLTDAHRRQLDPHAAALWGLRRDAEIQAGWTPAKLAWAQLGESSRDIWRYAARWLLAQEWKGASDGN